MKLSKNQIRLSEFHPSLLLDLEPQSILCAPLVVNKEQVLVDGYRRLHIQQELEWEVVEIDTEKVFEAALALNERTRIWDETDCFLWTRWARHLKVHEPRLPFTRFPEELYGAPEDLLRLFANRKLLLRQAQIILQAPARYREFFQRFLTQMIQLNANETAQFVEMACDLAKREGQTNLEELFRIEALAEIRENSSISHRQKGEALLKEMRRLRYPYYQKESDEFSSNWRRFNFQGVRAKKNLFVERGVLEITLSATSLEDMKMKILQLRESLDSLVWRKIWGK